MLAGGPGHDINGSVNAEKGLVILLIWNKSTYFYNHVMREQQKLESLLLVVNGSMDDGRPSLTH